MNHERAQRRFAEAGWSLVDLLLGILLALVVLASVTRMNLETARQRRTNQELDLAVASCQSKLEELRSLPVEELMSQDGRGFEVRDGKDATRSLKATPTDPDGLPMSVAVRLEDSEGAAEGVSGGESDDNKNKLYRVEVTVEWEGSAGTRSFKLTSLITNRRG